MLTSGFLALTPDPDKQLAHIYISRHVVIFGGVSENVNYNMVGCKEKCEKSLHCCVFESIGQDFSKVSKKLSSTLLSPVLENIIGKVDEC